jgi:hypothetical protein
MLLNENFYLAIPHLWDWVTHPKHVCVSVGEPSAEGQQNHWVKRSSLVDSRTSVTDVKFAPKHLGLQLVSISYF